MDQTELQEFLNDLTTLCAIDSGDYHAEGVKAMAAFFRERYEALGLQVECRSQKDFAPFLTARNSTDAEIDVLFVAHMDTVFPVGTGAQRPLTVDGQQIARAPGCVDCKGGCLLIYALLKRILQKGACPFRFCVALNSDEERSSLYSRAYFEDLARRSKYCFVFEPGRANDEFVSQRKGGASYFVKCRGIAAHPGVDPEKGASAILELSRWINELDKLTDYEKGTTLNVGRFQGGGDNGSVPDYAEFTLSVRYLEKPAALSALLETMQTKPFDPRTTIEVEERSERSPMLPHEATQALLRTLRQAGAELGLPTPCISTGGASDGNFISPYGVATLDGCGPCGGKLHTAEEYLKVASIGPRLSLMERLLALLFPAQ